MSLVLRVTSINNKVPQSSIEFEFDKNGGTIGRKLTNTWVLPDEQRHLSGSHASVEYEDGEYHIIDTSTNGVFVNSSDKPLGKGNKQLLEDGFHLIMGTFNIEVILESAAVTPSSLATDISTASNTSSTDDLFSDLFDYSEKNTDDNLFEPLDPLDKNSQISIGSDDPFFDFDEFNTDSNSQIPMEESIIEDNKSEMDSFFKPAEVSRFSQDNDNKKDEKSTNINTNQEKSFFESDNNHQGIPDDWNVDNTAEASDDDFFTDFDDSSNLSDKQDLSFLDDQKELSKNNLPKDIFVPAEISPQEIESTSSAFLKGLGIDDNSFNSGLSEQQLFLAGKLFRSAIKGTVDVLQSRAEIKNEMRMDMTTIQPIQNNPIKFAVDIDEAIKKLLAQENKSYMDPEQAMNEVYDDITSHQLAIISGIQASLSHVLKRFEPKNLITRFEEESPISSSIPVHRKAKLWEAFENLYGAIETEAEDDFNRLFGQEFAKAYDKQVEMLKKKRTK